MFNTFVAQKAPAGRRKNKATLRKREDLIEKCKSQSAHCAVAPNLQERFFTGLKQCCSHRRVAGHLNGNCVSERIPSQSAKASQDPKARSHSKTISAPPQSRIFPVAFRCRPSDG